MPARGRHGRGRHRWRYWLAGGLIVGSLTALRSRSLQDLDRRAGERLATPMGTAADAVIGTGTDLGSIYGVVGTSAVLAATGRVHAAVRVAGAGALAWTAAQVAKPLVDRPRPYEAHQAVRLVSRPAGASWPSGHVAVAAGVASAVADDLPPRGRSGMAAMALFVAHSRVYVGVHYISDVLAGLGIGVVAESVWRGIQRRAVRWLSA